MTKRAIVIAAVKSWNIARARGLREKFGREWKVEVIGDRARLTYDYLERVRPEYVFFPHWSWMIPEKVYTGFRCVVFHMTDLPFGRGGSPLQNLIARGISRTRITALKAGKGADTGPVYFKRDFDISYGNADQILRRASKIIFDDMIPRFLAGKAPFPQAQKGKVVEFVRRKPQDSDILNANIKTKKDMLDFVRMLDGEGYPRAYVRLGGVQVLFKDISEHRGILNGRFEVIKHEGK